MIIYFFLLLVKIYIKKRSVCVIIIFCEVGFDCFFFGKYLDRDWKIKLVIYLRDV